MQHDLTMASSCTQSTLLRDKFSYARATTAVKGKCEGGSQNATLVHVGVAASVTRLPNHTFSFHHFSKWRKRIRF